MGLENKLTRVGARTVLHVHDSLNDFVDAIHSTPQYKYASSAFKKATLQFYEAYLFGSLDSYRQIEYIAQHPESNYAPNTITKRSILLGVGNSILFGGLGKAFSFVSSQISYVPGKEATKGVGIVLGLYALGGVVECLTRAAYTFHTKKPCSSWWGPHGVMALMDTYFRKKGFYEHAAVKEAGTRAVETASSITGNGKAAYLRTRDFLEVLANKGSRR